MINNAVKKACRIYFTTSAENSSQFPDEVIDKAEVEYDRIFNSGNTRYLIDSGCFVQVDGSIVITEKGKQIAEEEVNNSKQYLESNKNRFRDREPRPRKEYKQQDNLLKQTMMEDSAVLMVRAIYALQKLQALDIIDQSKGTGKPGNRVRKVIESFMDGGEHTIIPRAKDKDGNPMTERTGFCFNQEYTVDSVAKELIAILQDRNLVNDCCKFTSTEE